MAGEAAQQGVFGDEAKIAVGKSVWRARQSPGPALATPKNDVERRGRNKRLGERVGDGRVGVAQFKDLKLSFFGFNPSTGLGTHQEFML